MRNRILFSLYLISIFLAGFYAFKRPYYNWDMLGYMAVVLGYENNDAAFVHSTVYGIAKQQLPFAAYNQLIDGGLEFRKRVAANSNEFYKQMPFYAVKPLYTGLVFLFYKAGCPLIQATILPSLIGYFLIGVLLVYWLRMYLQFPLALAVSFLTLLSAPIWDV